MDFVRGNFSALNRLKYDAGIDIYNIGKEIRQSVLKVFLAFGDLI